jgi:hypothetical protein
MTLRPLLLGLALVLAGGLSACGKTGELEQPAPLVGKQAQEDYQAKKAQEAAARAQAEAAARAARQNNTVFDQNAGPAQTAPFAPPIPGRTDPLGPPPVPGAGQNDNREP